MDGGEVGRSALPTFFVRHARAGLRRARALLALEKMKIRHVSLSGPGFVVIDFIVVAKHDFLFC